MADKPLGKIYFPILRKTPGDTGRVNPDPFGVFSCRLSTARFLDIDKFNINLVISREKAAYTRVLTLVDGTILKQSAENSDGQVAASLITLPIGGKGSRSVILKSGKKTKLEGNIYHTLSFRFPAWATVWCIADALGEIIPATKIKSDATATDVFPYFTIKGGRRYPIMAKTEAEGNTDASVPANDQEAQALLTQSEKKGTAKKAAGGDA
ncbi:MAG: hypothetical protein KME60_07085 [Cyanomargarita calcarea GSE-NOS-MK-12-04C]|jgi:hypothetical protein|uniref:Uncharacterized protein n=1 Tax=Cyanomargarita calcarea GSE-NOS-MK-12-04C TaxID=2839659 RepID=A0A951UR81_9CYAN|nr:hypothetical protein [Cyanomargarita calcarea GSE-NOS-MK-12-04C]